MQVYYRLKSVRKSLNLSSVVTADNLDEGVELIKQKHNIERVPEYYDDNSILAGALWRNYLRIDGARVQIEITII